MPMASHLLPSEPHTDGPMPGVSDGPMTTAPAPSPSRKEMVRSRVVDDVGELFGADHEHILGGAGTDQRIGLGDAVAVAGAGGGDVEGRGRRRAEAVGEARGSGRRRVRVGHGGDDDGTELGGLDAGLLQGLAGGALGHVDHADVGGGAVAGDDAGALADPLVGGIDPLADVVVGDDDVGPVRADAQDAGVLVARVPASAWERSCLSLQFCE